MGGALTMKGIGEENLQEFSKVLNFKKKTSKGISYL